MVLFRQLVGEGQRRVEHSKCVEVVFTVFTVYRRRGKIESIIDVVVFFFAILIFSIKCGFKEIFFEIALGRESVG
jgi:hypothetical protein